jgi:hypothetical protein
MSDLQWMVRDLDPDEEIPEPDQWPEDEFGPVEEEGELDGGQE